MLKAFQRLQRAHCASSLLRFGAQSAGMLKPLNSTSTWMLAGGGKSRFFLKPKKSTLKSRILCLFAVQAQVEVGPTWRGCPHLREPGDHLPLKVGTLRRIAGGSATATKSSSSRGISAGRGLHIHVQPQRRITFRRVTVSVGVIVRRALCREALPLRRLRKLPDISRVDSTLRRSRWLPRKRASRRRRANVVSHKKRNLSSASILLNIVGSDDTDFAFSSRNPRAINPGTKSGGSHRIHPGEDVRLLLRQHAPAFLDVEKDNGVRWEAFSPGRFDSGLSIRLTQRRRVVPQVFVEPSVEQDKESESRRVELRAVPCPGIRLRPRRIVEPVSRKRKCLAQGPEVGVARIVVAVKAEIGGSLSDSKPRKDQHAKQEWGSKEPHAFLSLRSRCTRR